MPILARASATLAALDLELVLPTADSERVVHLGRGVTLDRSGRVLVRGAPLATGQGRAVLRVVGSARVVLEL